MTFHLDDGFSISRELHTRTGCQLLHMFMMPIFDDFKRRPLFIIIRGGACIHRFQWKRPALFKQLKQKRSFPVLWLPCFWWAPFRSFGVCGVISARIGSSIFSDVIAKVSSLKKIQQDHISYIGIESFSAAVILSQAGKDHEKSSEHESKDKQAAKLHKQCHDVGHADWSYHQHVLCTSAQALKQRCLPVLNVRILSIPLHLLDTVQSTLFFFALFIPNALINHGWAISINSGATSKTRWKHHSIKRLSQKGYPARPTGQEAKEAPSSFQEEAGSKCKGRCCHISVITFAKLQCCSLSSNYVWHSYHTCFRKEAVSWHQDRTPSLQHPLIHPESGCLPISLLPNKPASPTKIHPGPICKKMFIANQTLCLSPSGSCIHK